MFSTICAISRKVFAIIELVAVMLVMAVLALIVIPFHARSKGRPTPTARLMRHKGSLLKRLPA